MPIIKGKADTESVLYSDGFKTYDGLVNYGYKNILGSNMEIMNLPIDTTISMESKTSGDYVKYVWLSFAECISIPFIYM